MTHKGFICHGFDKDGTVEAFAPGADKAQVVGRVARRTDGSVSEAYDAKGNRVSYSFGELDHNKAFAAIIDSNMKK